jgi:hypothetical protein
MHNMGLWEGALGTFFLRFFYSLLAHAAAATASQRRGSRQSCCAHENGAIRRLSPG